MREPADRSRSAPEGLDGYTPIWDAERTLHQQNTEPDSRSTGWPNDPRSVWRRLADVAARGVIAGVVLLVVILIAK